MHKNFFPYTFALLLMLLFSACAAVPPKRLPAIAIDTPQVTAFNLAGRISVAQGENGYYGNLHWLREGNKHEIEILSPLGQVIARLCKSASGYTLTTADQRVFQSNSSEELMHDALGFALPVQGLEHWIIGRAAPESRFDRENFPDGHIETLTQDGWKIVYADYLQPEGMNAVLPKKITLRRDDMVIKLVIDKW
jgi:outer membrane lipoprotein LolB